MNQSVDFSKEFARMQRDLGVLKNRQLPFATAQTLSELASQISDAEVAALPREFDRPTPFTLKSVGFTRARKNRLVAKVYVKDIAAKYLEPYEFGGLNVLNSKVLLKPVDQPLNQYGNIPRATIARLKQRSDIFVGSVKGIDGVWQRESSAAKVTASKTGRVRKTKKGLNTSGHLKLLIRFTPAHEATQRWGYMDRADKIAKTNYNSTMGRNLAKAIATSK